MIVAVENMIKVLICWCGTFIIGFWGMSKMPRHILHI